MLRGEYSLACLNIRLYLDFIRQRRRPRRVNVINKVLLFLNNCNFESTTLNDTLYCDGEVEIWVANINLSSSSPKSQIQDTKAEDEAIEIWVW